MTQTSELQKLYARKKEYKIPKEPKPGQEQATIYVTPLDLESTDLIDSLDESENMKEMFGSAIKLIAKSLQATEEEVKPLSFEHLHDIMDCIEDANNFKGEDKSKIDKVKEFLKQKQDARRPK